jgi:L-cysteine S-thiosulfotransferase
MKPIGLVLALIASVPTPVALAEDALRSYVVRGDSIDLSLTGRPGDPTHGAQLVADRQRGLCLLCHTGPFPDAQAQGTLAPDLGGVGARLSEGQLRLRIVDMKRLSPDTIMPTYYRVDGLERVAPRWRGKPVLTAEEIEDVVAYLATLKE